MEVFITIVMMMMIGGVIGGFTNYLAIKMLFRPYRAYYIGKWKVPFTPGLIPKRRDELAKQLGKMVVTHLLTPESLQKKFTEEEFLNNLTKLAQNEISKVLDSEKSLENVLAQLQIENGKGKLTQYINGFIENKYESVSSHFRNQPLNVIIPTDLQIKIENKIPLVSQFIINKGIDYFSSIEGKFRIQRMFDEFLKERGMLGNMLQMFLGNSSLADKIQPEIIKFLSSEGTTDLLNTLLHKEWTKLSEKQFDDLEDWIEKDKIIRILQEYSHKLINMDELMGKTLQSLLANYKERLLLNVIPKLVVLVGKWLTDRIGTILKNLNLEQIVEKQVETFSVERLEVLVLSITSRELKMITYLGFLLGAIIGFLQGLLAMFI